MSGYWSVKKRHRWLAPPSYLVGWTNRAGFGPVAEFDSEDEAKRHAISLGLFPASAVATEPKAKSGRRDRSNGQVPGMQNPSPPGDPQ